MPLYDISSICPYSYCRCNCLLPMRVRLVLLACLSTCAIPLTASKPLLKRRDRRYKTFVKANLPLKNWIAFLPLSEQYLVL